MKQNNILMDLSIGVACGYLATKVMEATNTQLEKLKSEESKRREREASPGQPTEVAVSKMEHATHTELSPRQRSIGQSMLHYGTGIGGGLAYTFLKRNSQLGSLSAGLATGLGVWAIVDETANPLLGITEPPQNYPLATHSSSLAAHLVYGATLTLVDLSLRPLIYSAKGTGKAARWTGKSGITAGKLYLLKKSIDQVGRKFGPRKHLSLRERATRRLKRAA